MRRNGKQVSKRCFFEKQKQKTFDHLALGPVRQNGLKSGSFFASPGGEPFFSKKAALASIARNSPLW
jgi:hypothetical protein